jgi:hypothetical protein
VLKKPIPATTIIREMNTRIREMESSSTDITLQVTRGRPQYEVLSIDPLAYRKFGLFSNRAPYLAGTFAVRGVLSVMSYEEEAVYPYVILDDRRAHMYAVNTGGIVMNHLIKTLELPYQLFESK